MPFEIKTGMSKAGMEHRAQTMLYTLLMEERYGIFISCYDLFCDADSFNDQVRKSAVDCSTIPSRTKSFESHEDDMNYGASFRTEIAWPPF